MKMILCFFYGLIFALSASAAELSQADRSGIEKLVHEYLTAFDAADYPALKKCVTDEFIDLVGGEKHFKKELKEKKPVTQARQIEAIHIVRKTVGTFVQFNITASGTHGAEIMADDDWFRVAKIAGSWKFQRHETDFPLED